MKIKITIGKIYDTDDVMEEFLQFQDDYPPTLSALEEFIIDRFVSPHFDADIDVVVQVQP